MYQASVALNGTGVSLLERHRYHDAMLVFKDALDLIRAAQEETLCCSKRSISQREAEISHYLRKASHRLEKSTFCTHEFSPITNIIVLSDNLSPKLTLQIAKELFNSESAFALRIDDCRSSDDTFSMELESATILYNFATAYLCYLRTVPSSEAKLFQGPYRFFHLALGVISRKSAFDVEEVDDMEAMRMLVVSILVVKSLMHLSSRLRMMNDAKGYHDKLCYLRAALLRLEQTPRLVTMSPDVHAAAA
jgi:hypothetical protein